MGSVLECAHLCLFEHPRCKSINYEKEKKQQGLEIGSKCQLNNKTKATKPEELVPDFAFNYFQPFKVGYGLVFLFLKQYNYQVCC